MVTALLGMNTYHVATQEPGVLPSMLSIDSRAPGAESLALLNGKVALSDPLVVVSGVVARHLELLLLGDSGDRFGNDCGDSAGAEA